MKQKSIVIMKKIMSVICAIAVCVTGLYVVDWTGSDVQAAYSEISITSTNSTFAQNGKLSNIVVSTITGCEKEGANFLTEEFANNWMTFGGGLTYDELVTGLRKAVVATDSIIQFNWNHSTTPRTEGFAAGASFTMKQGAPLPYNGKDAYVQLDADYTFTFQAPTDSSTQYNTIVITKQKTRTVSLGGNTSFTYRAEGNNLNFDSTNTTSDANSGDYYIVDYNNNTLDESYEEYIDFAGFSLAELKDTYQMRIKFTPTAKCIQIVSWGTVGAQFQVGDSIVFHKGMPVKYKNESGENIVAYLDNSYEYRCTSVSEGHAEIFKLYVLGEYGLSGKTYVSTSDTDKYVDFRCEADSFSDTTEDIKIVYTDSEIMKNYFEVSGKSYDDLVTNGYKLRAYSLIESSFKTLRFNYTTLGLNDEDTVLFKKGFPVEYTTTAGKTRIEVLDKDYGYVYDADTNSFTYDSTLGNSEVDTFKDVTIKKLGSISAFNTTSNEWDIYPIPNNPAKVPGIEGVTTFEAKYEINDKEYNGTFTRSDDTKGLHLTIPVENLAADADGVFVTIKTGEYASSGTSAGINITDDYVIYVHNNALTQYEGDVYCETDSDTYIVSEADTVQIDGETYQRGAEYAKSGTHVLTYTVDGCTYAKRLIIYRIGDISDDSEISVTDLVAIKKLIADKREVSMSGMEAADMDMDDVVTTYDTNLLRKYLVTEQGVLVLSPREGNTVANASDAAEGLIVDYYYEKSELYKTGEDIYHRDITILKWLSFENVETYTVALATTEDMSDSVLYQTTDCSLKLMNLLTNTDYYWTVTAGEFVSPIQTFHTADTIRTITVEGVSNTRDGGGWKTEDDKVVKQGMFYRGGKLEGIRDSGLTVMNEQLGIKTDMDLRNNTETNGVSSPLGSSVQYVNYSGPYYWGTTNGINAEAYKDALVNEIRTFANKDNYPIYVHCSLGRDRTGTICFLINALLGVSEEDLYLDYEFSFLSVTGTMDNASVHTLVAVNFATMYNNVKAYAPDGTMADATEAFMLSIGVTQDEINMIRQLLLQDS